MRIYFFLIGLFLLSACESTVTNVTPPKVDPELVVFSFLSPEADSILVEVRMTTPVFAGGNLNNDRVSDATVVLRGNGAMITLPYTTNGRYVISQNAFPLSPGITYSLEVTTPRGHRATAVSRIPLSNPLIDSVQMYTVPSGFGEYISLNRIFWQDAVSEANFYRIISRSVQPGSFNDTSYFNIDNSMLTDDSKNGQQMNGSVEFYSFEEDSIQNLRDILLLTTDEPYYKYHVKRLNYTGSNPFEEPLPMHDNIDGGVGCFSSYRLSRYKIGF
mgnify:CR=1 FL=1